jgi:hypothetical protein
LHFFFELPCFELPHFFDEPCFELPCFEEPHFEDLWLLLDLWLLCEPLQQQ